MTRTTVALIAMTFAGLSTATAQSRSLAGTWNIDVALGLRDGVPVRSTATLVLEIRNDSVVGSWNLAPQDGRESRPFPMAASITDGPTTFQTSNEMRMVREGVPSTITRVTTWVLSASGDSISGTWNSELNGTSPMGVLPLKGVRQQAAGRTAVAKPAAGGMPAASPMPAAPNVAPTPAADPSADREGVQRAALDYLEGFYDGDSTKHVRSVHPNVYKVGVNRRQALSPPMTYQEFHDFSRNVRANGGARARGAVKEVQIYEVLDLTASAKVTAYWGTDYLLMAKIGGRWMITHVIYQGPQASAPR